MGLISRSLHCEVPEVIRRRFRVGVEGLQALVAHHIEHMYDYATTPRQISRGSTKLTELTAEPPGTLR